MGWAWSKLLLTHNLQFAEFWNLVSISTNSKNKKNKEKTAKRIKEAKFRPRIEEHDYITKLRRSEKFLHQGNKLKVTLMFRVERWNI